MTSPLPRAGLPWPTRLRQVINVITLATPLGLLLAVTGRARIARGPHGTLLAHGYRSPIPAPRAGAVTVGDVVLLRVSPEWLEHNPQLLEHEARHCAQWAWFAGPIGFLPAYWLAGLWSWIRVRDFALANPFEVRADLVAGGYLPAEPSDPAEPAEPRTPDEPA